MGAVGNMKPQELEKFIDRWGNQGGGQERANYALFLSELCDVIGVARPEPANADSEVNDYVFERAVKEPNPDGTSSHRRIDLYKRSCFVLEAKQSRLKSGSGKELPADPDLFGNAAPRGKQEYNRQCGSATRECHAIAS